MGLKLNKKLLDIFKTTQTTSDTDTYSCNYINTQLGNKQPLVNYSTSEVDTGVKWIDGKTIYRKVISSSFTTASTNKSYTLSSLGLNTIDTLITIKSISQGNPIEEDYYEGSIDKIRTYIDGTNLNIILGSSYPTRPCLVQTIVEYTKTTN